MRTIAAFVLLLAFMSAPVLAANYNCGDPSQNHCYGVTGWQEKPEYFGAYADISITTLDCTSGCGGFVDDEIWLIDDKSGGCTGNSFGMCWVEAGYFRTDGASGMTYFWADSRPLATSTFNLHVLGAPDPVGTTDHFMLIKDARGGAGIFQLWIYNDNLSTLYQGTSTSNTMAGDRVLIGQELAGTQNASAGNANFTRNIWAVQALGPEYVFWYNRQTTNSAVTSQNPPTASWIVNPSSPPPPEGGQFQTHCCS
ncbi:MAG: hypothetical protein NVS9B15_13610 [Acidobacteriaceae bacterium]